jgi:transketolase
MQIRLLERMKNHDGKRSILVLRPADTAETIASWRLAMENQHAPTAILLSRQVMPDLPATSEAGRFKEATEISRGAYTVFESNDIVGLVLVANGSEVATLVAAAKNISLEKKIGIRVISVISQGLFREQPASYRERLIPLGVPIFGLTAGLPCTLDDVVGVFGVVHGLERFGASAPFTVLDEKFGFNVDAVENKIKLFLEEHKLFVAKLTTVLAR